MQRFIRLLFSTFGSVYAVTLALPAAAQHLDVQVQGVDGKLTTGAANFDGGSFTLGLRVFTRFFPFSFAVDDPGFNAVGTTTGTLPPGSDALPGNSDLLWDFLPTKVSGVTSNLLYWNGAGATPGFGLAPTVDHSLSLFGKNDIRAAADGSAHLIPGNIIQTTAADGFIHIHRFFFLDNDHDDGNSTIAAAGVYLIAMRLRMNGLDRSDPFYIVWGTPGQTGPSAATLDAAKSWVQDRADLLTPNYSADFDGDLDVDGADFLTWQRGLGSMTNALQINGDADGDHAVTASDLDAWRVQLGSNLQTFVGASSVLASTHSSTIPEPHSAVLIALVLCAAFRQRRHRASLVVPRLIAYPQLA